MFFPSSDLYSIRELLLKLVITGGVDMTKRIVFRGFSFLIACVLLFSSISATAFASDEWQTDFKLPKWTYIIYVGGGVLTTTDSQGRHKVGGDMIVRGGDNIAEIEATVQRYNGGLDNNSQKRAFRREGGV